MKKLKYVLLGVGSLIALAGLAVPVSIAAALSSDVGTTSREWPSIESRSVSPIPASVHAADVPVDEPSADSR
ncbi:MAG: hypothetical protein LBR21_09120 [Propionibacteriaceae bacterium]|nr:hypothetical protein [Propionibacteriaceae bacterium]